MEQDPVGLNVCSAMRMASKRISAHFSTLATNTTSYLRNVKNGAEVRQLTPPIGRLSNSNTLPPTHRPPVKPLSPPLLISTSNPTSTPCPRCAAHRRDIATTVACVDHLTSPLPARRWRAQIFLVGTAHVSKASVEEVRATIQRVRPATVLVELDAGRAQKLRSGSPTSGTDIFKVLARALHEGCHAPNIRCSRMAHTRVAGGAGRVHMVKQIRQHPQATADASAQRPQRSLPAVSLPNSPRADMNTTSLAQARSLAELSYPKHARPGCTQPVIPCHAECSAGAAHAGPRLGGARL